MHVRFPAMYLALSVLLGCFVCDCVCSVGDDDDADAGVCVYFVISFRKIGSPTHTHTHTHTHTCLTYRGDIYNINNISRTFEASLDWH